jgi:hypothetical protein
MQMNLAKDNSAARQRPILRAALWLVAGVILFLAIIQSLTITVAWWRGELPAMHAADWIRVLMFPFLIWIYLRFFSIFRPDCRACLPDDHRRQSDLRGP